MLRNRNTQLNALDSVSDGIGAPSLSLSRNRRLRKIRSDGPRGGVIARFPGTRFALGASCSRTCAPTARIHISELLPRQWVCCYLKLRRRCGIRVASEIYKRPRIERSSPRLSSHNTPVASEIWPPSPKEPSTLRGTRPVSLERSLDYSPHTIGWHPTLRIQSIPHAYLTLTMSSYARQAARPTPASCTTSSSSSTSAPRARAGTRPSTSGAARARRRSSSRPSSVSSASTRARA